MELRLGKQKWREMKEGRRGKGGRRAAALRENDRRVEDQEEALEGRDESRKSMEREGVRSLKGNGLERKRERMLRDGEVQQCMKLGGRGRKKVVKERI